MATASTPLPNRQCSSRAVGCATSADDCCRWQLVAPINQTASAGGHIAQLLSASAASEVTKNSIIFALIPAPLQRRSAACSAPSHKWSTGSGWGRCCAISDLKQQG